MSSGMAAWPGPAQPSPSSSPGSRFKITAPVCQPRPGQDRSLARGRSLRSWSSMAKFQHHSNQRMSRKEAPQLGARGTLWNSSPRYRCRCLSPGLEQREYSRECPSQPCRAIAVPLAPIPARGFVELFPRSVPETSPSQRPQRQPRKPRPQLLPFFARDEGGCNCIH